MKVVIVGGDGRAHAWRNLFARFGHDVVVSGGKAGVPGATATKPEDLVADLYVISPEVPLVDGMADRLRALGKAVIGPGKAGAELEASKAWMKWLVSRAHVPTAKYEVAAKDNLDDIETFIRDELGGVAVIKTDYLAAGKGVRECFSLEGAMEDIHAKLELGEVVVEQYLKGREASAFFLCVVTASAVATMCLGTAVDYKKSGEGDEGINTGGIGCYSPAPGIDADRIKRDFIMPTLQELQLQGIEYIGIFYAGLMISEDDEYSLLEYNIRFGDPEAQAIMPRIQTDPAPLFLAAAQGKLDGEIEFSRQVAVTVVKCAEGYPTGSRPGGIISGVDTVVDGTSAEICFSGTDFNDQGELIATGGRVLSVTAVGDTIEAARTEAYKAAELLNWQGAWCRPDIAKGVSF